MKSIIKIFTLALTLIAVIFACTLISTAEEVMEPPAPESIAEVEISSVEANSEQDETPATEKFIFSDFFEDKILPLLTNATVLSLVTAAITIFSQRGKKGLQLENSELRGAYTKQLKIYELVKEQIPTAIQEYMEKLKAELKELVLEELKLDPQAYATLAAAAEVISAKLDALTSGALVAWGNSPAAREALTACTTQSALMEAQTRCKQYEDYIRGMKGAEAEEIIASVREA